MKKLLLVGAALLLTTCGVLTGAPRSYAYSPVFPSCITTQLRGDLSRYWLDPGNLYEVRSVTVGGVQMSRRRDDVWVADAPRPETGRDVYFRYNHSNKGAWVHCGPPRP